MVQRLPHVGGRRVAGGVQAIKNNAQDVPALMSLQQNYIGGAGQVALREALEEAYGMTEVEITIKM